MSTRSSNAFAVAVIIAVMAQPAIMAGRPIQGKPRIDLTGTWVLNRDLSDKPGQFGAVSSGSGSRSGGGRAGGMGGRGRMMNPDDRERTRSAIDAVLHTSTRLIIVNADPGLVITDEDGVSTRLALDGSKETGAINGVPFETTTKWEGDALRVNRKFKGGLTVQESYSVSADPRLLTVVVKIEGGRGGGQPMTRVYDFQHPS